MDSLASLRVVGLSGRRGDRRLFEGVEFELVAGQSILISGANGSGKTTLLKTLCGLRRPEHGQVLWGDEDVHAGAAAFAGNLAYLGHENALNPDLTPQENLRMLVRLGAGQILDQGLDKNAISTALAAIGLPKSIDRPCRALSAGQRRRVALARLRLVPARLWVLDEPAASLDAASRDLLGDWIVAHVQAGGMAVFTTHEPLPLAGCVPQHLSLSP